MTRVPHLAAVLLAAAALTACGTSPGSPSAASSSSTTNPPSTAAPSTENPPPSTASPPSTELPTATPAAGGPHRCTAGDLQGSIRPKDSAAGNRYAELAVTNVGPATCTLQGYGGLGLVDASGAALPTSTARDEKPGPTLVTLKPGQKAGKLLHWGVIATGSEPVDRPCQPAATRLNVIPPDERQPFSVSWDLGPVCAAGTFHDSAFYAL
jgi:Protein of unknown function (DUF4232)